MTRWGAIVFESYARTMKVKSGIILIDPEQRKNLVEIDFSRLRTFATRRVLNPHRLVCVAIRSAAEFSNRL
jgi:hypothetical protein